jgi:hypothetical protein
MSKLKDIIKNIKPFSTNTVHDDNIFELLKCNITDYKNLTVYEKYYLQYLTEEQKIEIILLYDKILESIIK